MRAAVVVPMLLLLSMAGCGITAGTVEAKGHDDAYTFYTQQCIAIGNNPCGSFVLIPNYVDECWRLDLRSVEDTGSVCVDRADWDRVRVGERWGQP